MSGINDNETPGTDGARDAAAVEVREAEPADPGAQGEWPDERVRAVLEAMLFAADEPLDVGALLTALPEVREDALRRALAQMTLEWTGEGRGIHLYEVAGGYQLRTNPSFHQEVAGLFEAKPTKLSRAAMETLAIVAYRQPVTKAIVDEIRGVDCGGVLRSLTEFELVAVIGKADDIGRPNLYGTTRRFLEFFGLGSLTDLPTLEEFEIDALELLGEDVEKMLGESDEDEAVTDG